MLNYALILLYKQKIETENSSRMLWSDLNIFS